MSLHRDNVSFWQKLPDHLLHRLAVIHIEGLRVWAKTYPYYAIWLFSL